MTTKAACVCVCGGGGGGGPNGGEPPLQIYKDHKKKKTPGKFILIPVLS